MRFTNLVGIITSHILSLSKICGKKYTCNLKSIKNYLCEEIVQSKEMKGICTHLMMFCQTLL